MSRLRGLMKMLSGVLTPIGAAFAALAAAMFLALLMLFSARVLAFMPVLAVLMVLLWRWVDRFLYNTGVSREDTAIIGDDKPENP